MLPSVVAVPQDTDWTRSRRRAARNGGRVGADGLADFSISFASNVHAVPDLLVDGGYDPLVLAIDEDVSPLQTLADLRCNSRLYHFPVIVIADPAHLSKSSETKLHAANDVLMRPLGSRDLQAGAGARAPTSATTAR